MPEAVHGTIYIAKCTRTLLCRYKSEKLHVGSQYGITDLDYVPAACTTCQLITTVNILDNKTSNHCPTCKEPLHLYMQSGAENPKPANLCPKCQQNTLVFEIAGFMR
jgi:hypothetical protein